ALPANPAYRDVSGLSLDGLSKDEWHGTVADRIVGLDRYTDGHLVLELAWSWEKSGPTSGILDFSGTSTATGKSESFAIATWTVD
ncbi:MAG TPA: hypothetical protein VF294_06860, partial [Polyangiaceae bacterium]